MHGLRDPLLPRRVSAGQSHPGVERPGVPGRLARCHGATACHEQLPGVHRQAVPRSVRGRLRSRDQRGPGDDRTNRVRDRRACLGRRLGDAPTSHGQDGQVGGGGGIGAGRPGRRATAGPGGPRRDRVRAGGEAGRPAALRHPGVQDGEGRSRPAPGADGGRRGDLRLLDLGRWGAGGSGATRAETPPSPARCGAPGPPARPT